MFKSFSQLKYDFFNFLKNREKEILVFIAIATFIALILELAMLFLQNKQIQDSNWQNHLNRKTELVKFLFETKECKEDDCTEEPKYNAKIRSAAFQEYLSQYVKEDPNLSGAQLSNIDAPYSKIPFKFFFVSETLARPFPMSEFSENFNMDFYSTMKQISIVFNSSNLSFANFMNSDFKYARFSFSDLTKINFTKSNLRATRYIDCLLKGVKMANSNLKNSLFKELILEENSIFDYANFQHAFIQKVLFDKSSFKFSDFSYSKIGNSNFNQLDFSNSNFSKSRIRESSIISSIFNDSFFIKTYFKDVDIIDSDFNGADFKNTTLDNVFFENSDLSNANLSKSNVINIKFKNTFYSSKTKWPEIFDKTKLENLRKSKSLVCVDCDDQLNFIEVQLNNKS